MNSEKWKKVVDEEIKSLESNNTWTMTDLSKDHKIFGCNWKYSIKYKPDGEIERYKARLVPEGYIQNFEVDYFNTFNPIAKVNTIKIIIAIAAHYKWDLHQYDVKKPF